MTKLVVEFSPVEDMADTKLSRLMGIPEKFNGPSYVDFLTYILSVYDGPVFLIEDGASYHGGAQVNAFKARMEMAGRLFVERLPTYSPDKNPIEKLWKKTKRFLKNLP